MTMEKTDQKIKVLVSVYEPLTKLVKRKFDEACLKRDAYLDKALRIEAGFLGEEVTTPNSDKAKNFITENLKQLKLKPLNLLLSIETADLINNVCKEKKIPRDAFINRFFLLLIASDEVLETLFKDDFEEFFDGEDFYDNGEEFYYKRPNVLDTIEEFVSTSPFWRFRAFLSNKEPQTNLYSYAFEKKSLNKLPDVYGPFKIDNILGFNTFMKDSEVDIEEFRDFDFDINTLLDYEKEQKKEAKKKAAKLKQAGETK